MSVYHTHKNKCRQSQLKKWNKNKRKQIYFFGSIFIWPGPNAINFTFFLKKDQNIYTMIIHSFDVRGKPLAQARHWSAPETFGSRAKFNTASEPATLELEVSFWPWIYFFRPNVRKQWPFKLFLRKEFFNAMKTICYPVANHNHKILYTNYLFFVYITARLKANRSGRWT